MGRGFVLGLCVVLSNGGEVGVRGDARWMGELVEEVFLLLLCWILSDKFGGVGVVDCEVAVWNEEVEVGDGWVGVPRNEGVGVEGGSFARGKCGNITR